MGFRVVVKTCVGHVALEFVLENVISKNLTVTSQFSFQSMYRFLSLPLELIGIRTI